MKITFNSIHIKYYKSITNATLDYTNSVWLIKGTNNDAFGSNGAGKSTLLEALQQCLYNRTQNGNTLDTTVNRKTGKSYEITVILSTSDGDTFKIHNSRSAMKITISKLEDDTFVDVGTRSMQAALSYVQNIIGLDFNAFVALTHITHSTVVNMIDNFTGSNLLKVLLDFGLIQRYEKALKDTLSSTRKELDAKQLREIEIDKSITLIDSFRPADISPLYRTLVSITAELDNTSSVYKSQMERVKLRQDAVRDTYNTYKVLLKDAETLLDTKVCGTCGTDLTMSLGIDENDITLKIIQYSSQLEAINAELADIQNDIDELNNTLGVTQSELSQRVNALKSKIENQEYNAKMFDKSIDSIKELHEELVAIRNKKPEMLQQIDIVTSALSLIKQGKLHEGMLNEFCRLNNVYLRELMPYVGIDYLAISTKHNKNSFNFVLQDLRYDTQIEFSELSGGELTRVRLVVLLSMLKTVQIMTNTSVNILVFDEALDTLDASASDSLASLFRYLTVTENKFIAMVSHGQQLNSIDFIGNINVVKTEGVTRVIQETIGGN